MTVRWGYNHPPSVTWMASAFPCFEGEKFFKSLSLASKAETTGISIYPVIELQAVGDAIAQFKRGGKSRKTSR